MVLGRVIEMGKPLLMLFVRLSAAVIGMSLLGSSALMFIWTDQLLWSFVAVVAGSISVILVAVALTGVHTGFLEDFNGDLESAKCSIARLIMAARDDGKIQILSGTLTPEVWLTDPVFKALEEAIARHVSVHILLGEPEAGPDYWPRQAVAEREKWARFSEWVERGDVTLSKSLEPVSPHFIVVDELHVRREQQHPKRERGSGIQDRVAFTEYAEPGRARRYARRFEQYARTAVPVAAKVTHASAST